MFTCVRHERVATNASLEVQDKLILSVSLLIYPLGSLGP